MSAIVQDIESTETLIPDWSEGFTPPPVQTVTEWADARRMLPKKSAAKGARWRTSTVPYMAGIMNAIHEPGVKSIAMMKGAQVAGSEGMNNLIGYGITQDPSAMLLVHPTINQAKMWSKDRLDDMIESTPEIAAAINRDKSTLDYKDFDGGFLAVGGANTENSFARWSVRWALGDDVDRWPAVVGDEGDPAELLVNRVTTYWDGCVFFTSTPTLVGGRIHSLFLAGDQRRYILTCPGCGHEDWVTWSDVAHFHVTFEDRDASTARMACPSCQARLTELDRRAMVAAGFWRATAEPAEPGLVSFHLPGLLSLLGSVSLQDLTARFLTAHRLGRESLKVFINTKLGEAWEQRGTRMDPHVLANRVEDYGEDVEIPAWAGAVVAGVDVQEDRVEIQVQAFGLNGERAVVDYRRDIRGSIKSEDTRKALAAALERKYRHACGVDIPIHATCIDSGYEADDVYAFVKRYQARSVYATKGYSGRRGNPIVGKPSEKQSAKERPVPVFPVNVDDAKSDIMSALAQTVPGPNYFHLPSRVDTIDEEYFAQLCSEHEETVYNKRKVAVGAVWVLDRERNEALDTAVLCLAAFKLRRPNVRQMLEQIKRAGAEAKPEPTPPAGSTPNGTPASPTPASGATRQPAKRRISYSPNVG